MRILLVDDEQGFLAIMRDVLHDAGHEVVLAEDGKVARELLASEKIDLIVSDVFMPTLDGARFHSFVREFTQNADIPFIFISGVDDSRTRTLIVDPERDFFFSKTTPVEIILKQIDKFRKADSSKSGQHNQ